MVQATENYWSARVTALESELQKVQKELVLGLDSLEKGLVKAKAQLLVTESELAKALLRVSDLEMALDRERSLAMAKE